MEARTGIKKATIYNEFGDKNKLFLACIDNFLGNYCEVERILTTEPLGLKNIKAFFEYKTIAYDYEFGKGCLVFNSVIEEESISKEANQKVNAFLSKMKTLYLDCLKAARENPIALSYYIVSRWIFSIKP